MNGQQTRQELRQDPGSASASHDLRFGKRQLLATGTLHTLLFRRRSIGEYPTADSAALPQSLAGLRVRLLERRNDPLLAALRHVFLQPASLTWVDAYHTYNQSERLPGPPARLTSSAHIQIAVIADLQLQPIAADSKGPRTRSGAL
jgi:hypothetical protein